MADTRIQREANRSGYSVRLCGLCVTIYRSSFAHLHELNRNTLLLLLYRCIKIAVYDTIRINVKRKKSKTSGSKHQMSTWVALILHRFDASHLHAIY